MLLCPQSPSMRHFSHQIVEIQCGCFDVITAGSVQWRGAEILTYTGSFKKYTENKKTTENCHMSEPEGLPEIAGPPGISFL